MLFPASPKMTTPTPRLHDGVHAGCGPSMRGEACLLYAMREECFISSDDGAVSARFLWCGPIHRSNSISLNPPLPAAHLQARLDRVVRACVRAHACAQLCALVCVSKRAWILLQFDPTQIFLKEKQRRGGRLLGQRTRPAEPLHRSQWNLYL